MVILIMVVAVFAAVASIMLLLERLYTAAWVWLFFALSAANWANYLN